MAAPIQDLTVGMARRGQILEVYLTGLGSTGYGSEGVDTEQNDLQVSS